MSKKKGTTSASGDTFVAAVSTPSQPRTDCLACLMSGLTEIGISPTVNAAVDFGAINSDDLCITLAHSIEACLDGKGYVVAPLSTGFVQLRAAGTVVTIDDFVSALVSVAHPK
jgi:hypothetical protein